MLKRYFPGLYKLFTTPRTFSSPMTPPEACLILGGSDRVFERYKALMKINHPDVGGSKYLASKINEARDLIMN